VVVVMRYARSGLGGGEGAVVGVEFAAIDREATVAHLI
jgi:hypothetical protein